MNEAQAFKPEAGKYYRTSDGKKAFVAGINPFDSHATFPLVGAIENVGNQSWTKEGCYHSNNCPHGHNLVAEWVELKHVKGWVAVQVDMHLCVPTGKSTGGEVAYTSHVYASREEAVQKYGGRPSAIIEIDVLEGHGLGEAA